MGAVNPDHALADLANGILQGMGARLKVSAPDSDMFALAVGLARLYEREDRLIATGKVDMGRAFFTQPGRAPSFWPFMGFGRDVEAVEGWWQYAHDDGGELLSHWWRALLARLLAGQSVDETQRRPSGIEVHHTGERRHRRRTPVRSRGALI